MECVENKTVTNYFFSPRMKVAFFCFFNKTWLIDKRGSGLENTGDLRTNTAVMV